jgi:hypothetical protein
VFQSKGRQLVLKEVLSGVVLKESDVSAGKLKSVSIYEGKTGNY